MKTSHQLAKELLELPDLPVKYTDNKLKKYDIACLPVLNGEEWILSLEKKPQ